MSNETEWKLAVVVKWLEANQPDVFKRGLWDAVAPTPPARLDMRSICEALGFDPTNHHNAAACPYCTPPVDTVREALAGLLEVVEARNSQGGGFKPNAEAQRRIEAARKALAGGQGDDRA